MRPDDSQPVYAILLRREHRRLNRRVHALREQMGDPLAQDTARPLQALRDELANHFLNEEQGGCLEEAVCRLPSHSNDVRQLMDEHEVLLDQLDEIIKSAQSAERVHVLAGQFADFAKRLAEHEAGESRLLTQAFGCSCLVDEASQ